jgi:transposase-like protein
MIVVAVGWYLRFSLSYRDIEELLNERGLRADHVTSGGGSNVTPQKFSAEPPHRLRVGSK